MSQLNTEIPKRFRTVLGLRKDGRPIYLIGGGSVDSPEQIPAGVPTPQPPAQRYFTEDDLERARQQEKDKLYRELESLRQQLAPLQNQVEQVSAAEQARREAEEARQRAEAEAQRLKEESELSARELVERKNQEFERKIAEAQTDWESKFQQMAAEREQERVLLEKERQLATLQAYTQRRISEERENIAPELLDFVSGNTPEEIESSIERVKAKSAALVEAARQAFAEQRAQQRGVSPTGYAPVGPLEGTEGGTKQYSAEDIRNMDMNEYAKFRQNFPGIVGAQRSQGLYG